MNRKSLVLFFIAALLFVMAGLSNAGVNVNVNIGPPPVYTFSAPPELVVIPNTYVYFAPGVDMNIVFYHGYWYRPYNGYWYRGSGYNGPWVHIGTPRVPRYIINLPPDYRRTYYSNPRIPYGHVHSNWNRWEKERYWHKRHWKHDQNEWKQERREEKHGRKEMRQGHQQEKKQDHREMSQDKQKNKHKGKEGHKEK